MSDEAASPVVDEPTVDEPTAEQLRRKRRWRRVRRSVYAGFALLTLYYSASLWIVHSTGTSDQARRVDAIVVMGAAQYDGRPSPQLAARLDHVVELWDQGFAPMIITTGYKQPGDRFTEAESSRNYLVDRGVPATAIVQVGGTNSYETLREVRDAVRARGDESVLLVTDPYHSLRVRMISQELGLTAYVSPTRSSPVQGSDEFLREMREAAGVAVGRIIGFDSLLFLSG
ncbi:MAG: YdcF family protein [Actinomycetia bacterium]|nr:YdcF family protein [Actinomycetes bacterium]